VCASVPEAGCRQDRAIAQRNGVTVCGKSMRRYFRGLTLLAAVSLWTPARTAAKLHAHRVARPHRRHRDEHAVNMALQQLADTHMPLSASVLFVCPWYQEAVRSCTQSTDLGGRAPRAQLGVEGYRWDRCSGRKPCRPSWTALLFHFLDRAVPRAALRPRRRWSASSVRRSSGRTIRLRIDYVDYHMAPPWRRPNCARWSSASRTSTASDLTLLREAYHTMFDTPIAEKQSAFLGYVRGLAAGASTWWVHVGRATSEMSALIDLNNPAQNTATGRR